VLGFKEKFQVLPGIPMVAGFCITLILGELFEVLDTLTRENYLFD
jgi:hypothetical protein